MPAAATAARQPASPVPVPEPTAEPELGVDEWPALQRDVAPGELDVLVLRGRMPVVGARVRVQQRGLDGIVMVFARQGALAEATTGVDGRARFSGLSPMDHAVRADHDDEHVLAEVRVVAPEDGEPGRTAVLVFGTASIEGTAHDASGEPRAGQVVYSYASGGLPPVAAVTAVGADGRFALHGLRAGRHFVGLVDPQEWAPDHDRRLTLRQGETLRVTFGGPEPAGRVRGRVVDGDGGVVPGARQVRFVHADHGDERRVRTDPAGAFVVSLPPGCWRVGEWTVAGDAPLLGDVHVAAGEVRHDVRWPGARLLVQLAGAAVRSDEVARCLSLRGAGDLVPPDAVFVADGQMCAQWLGLAPGEYLLGAGNGLRFAGAAPGGFSVLVGSAPVQRLQAIVLRR